MNLVDYVSVTSGIAGILFGCLQLKQAQSTKNENEELKNELKNISDNTHNISHNTMCIENILRELLLKIIKVKSVGSDDPLLNETIDWLKQQLDQLEAAIRESQDAARWLEKKHIRIQLARDAGDKALKICSFKLSKSERYKFYEDIYKYVTWLFYSLNEGVSIPLDIISRRLQQPKVYQEAFKYIRGNIPNKLSFKAKKRVEDFIDHLIENLI